MILRHFEMFEKSTKNDPKMTKGEALSREIVTMAKISEFIVVENPEIAEGVFRQTFRSILVTES